MASWTRFWQEYGGGHVMPIRLKESVPGSSSVSPLSLTGDEVVRVLAGMVWALQEEA